MQTNSKAEIFEKIVSGIQTFPYQMQVEVLDFIGYLKSKLAIQVVPIISKSPINLSSFLGC
jgi:hypothetical protein